jgi:hypothetical protein
MYSSRQFEQVKMQPNAWYFGYVSLAELIFIVCRGRLSIVSTSLDRAFLNNRLYPTEQ